MVYFERKGCVQKNLYLNCVSSYKKVLKRYRMVRCQVLVIVYRTFCFTGVSYRAQLLRPIIG